MQSGWVTNKVVMTVKFSSQRGPGTEADWPLVFCDIAFRVGNMTLTRSIRASWRLKMAASVALAFAASAARADEGMWIFDNFPMAMVNGKYGTHIDQSWLDRVRGAAVRLS